MTFQGIGLAWYLGAFIVAIALLVFVHEWGHFIAARQCGVKVLRFSIGFGRVLASWRPRNGETEWTVSAIPLGGFVKMLDEREGPVAPEESARAFNNKPVQIRMLIVAAGPAANFLLAILLYWALYMHGVEDLKPILGTPLAHSSAASAGIQPGEMVTAVDGRPVRTWTDVRMASLQAILDKHAFTLETRDAGGNISYRRMEVSSLDEKGASDDPTRDLGLQLNRIAVRPVIGNVIAGGAAANAGLRPGDEVVNIGGHTVSGWDQVVKAVQQSAGKPVLLGIRRGNERLGISVIPEPVVQAGLPIGKIGVGVAPDPSVRDAMMLTVRYGVFESFGKACSQTFENSRLTLVLLGKMVLGEVSLRNLSGPVAIADYAGQSARLGIAPYLGFLALISVSIGLLNLLPIPVLDGGHLMYYLVELIKGSPVSERLQEVGQYIGLGALGLLMSIAIINDIHRLISG